MPDLDGQICTHIPWLPSEIRENLGPAWLPPRDRDVALDRFGNAWQYGGQSARWASPLPDAPAYTADQLIEECGPLRLVARDGLVWDA